VPEFREGAIVTEHSDDIGLPERYRDSLWNIPTALAYKGILLLSTRIAYGLFLARLIARVLLSTRTQWLLLSTRTILFDIDDSQSKVLTHAWRAAAARSSPEREIPPPHSMSLKERAGLPRSARFCFRHRNRVWAEPWPDLGGRWPSRLVATAAENRLSIYAYGCPKIGLTAIVAQAYNS
jgi:hypothetical protein